MSFSVCLCLSSPTFPLDKPTGDPPELARDNPACVPVMECWEAMEEERADRKKREITSTKEENILSMELKGELNIV